MGGAVRSCRHGHTAPRVLVIKDEGLIAAVVVETLADEGYDARAASDGCAALGLLGTWWPCLILLDVMMPVMDGRIFLRELGQLKGAADLPVVLVSGAGGP